MISRQFDVYGNELVYTYRGGAGYEHVTKITDGAGRETIFHYTSDTSKLNSITEPDGGVITFGYNAGEHLTTIVYPGGETTHFDYESETAAALLKSVYSSLSNTETLFTYAGTTSVVNGISYSSSDASHVAVSGSSTEYVYGDDLTTQVRYKENASWMPDKEIRTTYTFDTQGRAVSVIGDDDYQQAVAYTSKNETDNIPIATNKLKSDCAGIGYINNLLKNTSAENGETNYWRSTTTDTQSIESGTDQIGGEQKEYLGAKSFKLTNSTTARSAYYAQKYVLPADRADSYTFSAYVKTSGLQVPTGASTDAGACVIMAFYNGSAKISEERCYGERGSMTWTRLNVSADLPANTTEIRVYVGFCNSTGTMWADCLQLEEGDTANTYNMLENSDFSGTNAWTTENFTSGDSFVGDGEVDMKENTPYTTKAIYQTIPINKTNVALFFSSCADAKSVPISTPITNGVDYGNLTAWNNFTAAERNRYCALNNADDRDFSIWVKFIYTDGTLDERVIQFSDKSSETQQATQTLLSKNGKAVTSVRYRLRYKNNANTAHFYTAMMTLDTSGTNTTYSEGTYDGKKVTIVKTTDNLGRSATVYLDQDGRKVYSNDISSKKSQTFRDENGTVTAERTAQNENDAVGKGTTYSYDAYGNLIEEQTTNVSASGTSQGRPCIKSTNTYDAGGNYRIAETDALGNTTSYNVNLQNGLTNSVTDPNGNTTNYTYATGSKLMTQVSSGNASSGYAYDNQQKLTEITHNGFSYLFTYNLFGQMLKTSIGSRTLSTNVYDLQTRKLTNSTYGNGATVSYSYDKYGRTTAITKYGKMLSCVYNKSGQVAQQSDTGDNTKSSFNYDFSGKLITSYVHGGRTGKCRYLYDEADRLISAKGTIGGVAYSYGLDYNWDGTVSGTTSGETGLTGMLTNYTYDDFNRISSSLATSAYQGCKLKTNYTYQLVNGNIHDHTGRIAQIGYQINGTTTDTSDDLAYTYDANGNITAITKGGAAYVSYVYDGMNQLTRENNAAAGKTWVYTYDNGGNLLSKTEYAYTTGTLTAALSSKTYGYADSEWKDLLTSYDGQTITYDAIGNPLNYRGKNLYWSGRQLNTIVPANDDTTISYAYNAAGQRISKTKNGTVTEFLYDDSGHLVAQKNGTETIIFHWDLAADCMTGFTYGGKAYWYRRNQQGDVTGIVESASAQSGIAVEYEYDAWGNVISIGGYAASTIGQLNPIRYRGYYYDTETGLYYVSSRYYDPETCRFINADSIIDNRGVNTLNLFAYCGNNPVNNQDPDGHFFFGALVGGIIGGAAGAITALVKGKSVTAGLLTGAATGAAIGLVCDIVATGGMSAVVGVALCGVAAGVGNAVNQYANYKIEKKAQTQNKKTNKTSQTNNSSGKKTPTSSNGKLASECNSFADYVDVKSIAISSVTAMVFAPASMGANYVVNSAFSGVETAGATGFVAQFAANFAMGGNISILQSIIDLF